VRIVIDTNLLVSGVITAGRPRQLVDAAKAGEFELCTSEALLAELLDVLSRGKFEARLIQAGLTPAAIVDDLRKLAVLVAPTAVPRVVPTDPDDDHVLAAALAGHADLIASGDKRDLLPLGSYLGIEIVTASQAIEIIGGDGLQGFVNR
jgi:putative PIN family toxin of toxin-antitoxin system